MSQPVRPLLPASRDAQASITAYWDRYARVYDADQARALRRREVHQAWVDVWTRALPPLPAAVLDIGTGTGHVALMLAELGYDTTGLDASQGMLDQARAKGAALPQPPVWALGDAVDPPLAPASFDGITSRYLLWTLRQPEVALARWLRLLRPNGRLAVVDSPWFASGLRADPAEVLTERQRDFQRSYDDEVLSELPLAEASSIGDAVATIAAVGFHDVQVQPLGDILALDRRYGVADGHDAQLQYLLSATA